MSQEVIEGLRRAILGRYPLIYLVSWEEDRATKILQSFAAKVYQGKQPVTTWSNVSGFRGEIDDPKAVDPVQAIQAVRATPHPGFFVFQDIPVLMQQNDVVRALREAYYALRGTEKYLFLTCPEIIVPEVIKKELIVIEIAPPDEVEIAKLVKSFAHSYSHDQFDQDLLMEVSFALKGLTYNEAGHTLHRLFRSKDFSREKMLREIFKDKETAVKKAGYLEFVAPQTGIEQIGGLENLKAWLQRRSKLFSREAMEQGLPVPKGMLVMGMSGCGKSLAAKAVSHEWKTPLFRLDMTLLSSGMFGTPEAAFHRALKTVEGLAPAILWIDEIENSLGRDEDQKAEGNAQIFSSFLTWMQEKPPLIFVAATANRIQSLPAEVIRKGRFDQVFFVDLPTSDEREQIFRIHLERSGTDVAGFDLELLSIATKGWNGAEIEQAVAAARVDAFSEDRAFELSDITRNTAMTVPLSRTMYEQMKKIRSWAFGRATLASKEKYTEHSN